ncbi:MAG: hypothetical protein E6J65_09215 [Deltaproteobacteria bacterium]|nr:MAG: hypothetical protein E6J65_09215 [Deltaproteobacteria bacterium]
MGFRDWLSLRRKEPPMPATLHCTFCGRSGLEAEKIIGGPPPFFICDSCVGAYSEAAREETIALHDHCSFCGRTRRKVRWRSPAMGDAAHKNQRGSRDARRQGARNEGQCRGCSAERSHRRHEAGV